jgi:hypothetical protein
LEARWPRLLSGITQRMLDGMKIAAYGQQVLARAIEEAIGR